MNVSYVVLSYGKPDILFKCLNSFRKFHPEDPLIVVENGGPDLDKVESVCKMFNTKFWVDPTNTSLSRIMNKGVEMSETEYVCIVTNGVEFTKRLTEQFEKDFEADDLTVVVGGLLFYPDGRIQHGGGYRRWNEQAMGHYGHGKQLHQAQLCTIPAYRIYVTGATAAIRKSFWLENKYDEALTMSCEDTDICFRAWKAGKRVFYDPEISTIHNEGSTRGRTREEKMKNAPEAMKKEEESVKLFQSKYTDSEMEVMDLELNRLNEELHPNLPVAFSRTGAIGDVLRTLPFYRDFYWRMNFQQKSVVIITGVPEAFINEDALAVSTERDTYAISKFYELDNAYERRRDKSIDQSYAEVMGFGYPVQPWDKGFKSSPADKMFAQKQAPDFDWTKPYACVHMGVGWPSKTLPEEFWKALTIGLLRMGLNVVFVGARQDNHASGAGCADLVGKTSFRMLHAVLEDAKIFIGPDGGVLHMADGTCPAIGLFTITDPKKIVSCAVTALETKVACKGCLHRQGLLTYYDCDFPNDIRHHQCIYTFSSVEVLEKAREILPTKEPK